jgi:hypothetical protein
MELRWSSFPCWQPSSLRLVTLLSLTVLGSRWVWREAKVG